LGGGLAETIGGFSDCGGFGVRRIGGDNSALTLADKRELVVLTIPIDSYNVADANLLGCQQICQRVHQVALDGPL
jgi:hypothetical protein